MAGEYGVNIKFRVVGQSQLDKAKQKAKELEASVSKIRSLDLGKAIKGPVGDRVAEATGQIRRYATQLNKTGKVIGSTRVQQQSALEAFESLRDSVKIGSPIFNTLNKAIAQQTKLMNVNTTSVIKNTRAKNSNNRASVGTKGGMSGGSSALTSGLISGAFPLLFGQGPLGGAFGFAGGFLGTKVGGQMGGFAGGLVATSILQQLTTAIQGLNELGKALDPKTLNIDSISKSLGLLGTDTEKYLKLIEQTEGKQAAYNAAVQETTKLVGQDGVQALQSFADSSQNLTNEMSKFFTRLGSEIAKLVDKVNNQGQQGRIVGFERSNLLAEAKNVTDDAEIIAKVAEIEKERNRNKRTVLQDELVLLMKAKKIEDDRLKKLENSRMEYQLILKSLTDQNTFLQNAITLGSSEAAIIQEKTKLIEKAKKAQVDFDENEIDRQLRLKAELQRTKQLYDSIANSIQGGLVDALEGAINGTKSLGDVARSVFGAIQRQLINFEAASFLKSLPGIGGFFANGGRPPVGRASIVGERGPELFVPDRAGTIVPNHQLGGMGGSTSIVVNVDASGSSVEGDDALSQQLGQTIALVVQETLVREKRNGGLLA
tara:strand:- start:2100 stop:3899 length:1800 start_codon:yes stop_codon:yes gene_type:complete